MSLPDDRLAEIVRKMNGDPRNGTGPPMMPPNVKPRPSGWKCPKCGTVAEQRVEPAPGTILGYKWITLPDGKPAPVAVLTAERTGEDEFGNPRHYVLLHCLNCFNEWQRRKMMEEIRANTPALVYEGNPNEA